ncbi:hypothetical protein EVAR_9492_1 [Eumeta japonica]|uniref:Uncharacterized protein n=1 Tax=Eumeta variegata TaxID=151549 RepID=A0A4C1U3F8_EUMVA|nr:hypothetical protein EVAR_9492_1 [Eumeta japonica]
MAPNPIMSMFQHATTLHPYSMRVVSSRAEPESLKEITIPAAWFGNFVFQTSLNDGDQEREDLRVSPRPQALWKLKDKLNVHVEYHHLVLTGDPSNLESSKVAHGFSQNTDSKNSALHCASTYPTVENRFRVQALERPVRAGIKGIRNKD